MNGYKILKCFRKEKRISGELPCPATGLIINLFIFIIINIIYLMIYTFFKACNDFGSYSEYARARTSVVMVKDCHLAFTKVNSIPGGKSF